MSETAIVPVYDEKLILDWLLANSTITDLPSGERIWGQLPKDVGSEPMVRATRIGGAPDTRLLWLDHPLLQFDVWGGPKAQARLVADTIRAELAYGLPGAHDLGTVSAVEIGGLSYLPDASFAPARPRYTFDVTFTVHPNA